MLKELNQKEEIEALLSKLEKDIKNCLYIYIDLQKYGIDNPNIKVWRQKSKDGSINVIMKYHNGFQLYSNRSSYEAQDFVDLIRKYKPDRISGNDLIIQQLAPLFQDDYKSDYGVIFCYPKQPFKENLFEGYIDCRMAKYEDIPEIVDLMLAEKSFEEQYREEELISQLEERFRTGMGRSMVVREHGKIVAHIGTFAETDNIAVISGSVVQKMYRNTDYYYILTETFVNLICGKEQKNAYYFVTNKRHIKYYEKIIGSYARYGKLIKR